MPSNHNSAETFAITHITADGALQSGEVEADRAGDLKITHTSAEGTLIDGTSRGDGTAEILKANRWRWGRSIGAWYVPRSRDVPPKRHIINATAEQLRAAGFSVDLEVDAAPRDQVEAEADRAERLEGRAERLAARADKHQAASDAAQAASDDLSSRIPFGQPILLGHHSQRRAERDAERIRRGMERSLTEQRAANRDRAAADSAAKSTAHREDPYVVANRIDRLAAEIRKLERAGSLDRGRQELLDHDRAQLEHWQAVRTQQIADELVTVHSRETINAGDQVKISGGWWTVTRANPTTVTLSSLGCSTRTPYHQIRDHRPKSNT